MGEINNNEIPNIESKKVDSNGEEIVWELEREPLHKVILAYFLFYGLYLFYILFALWIMYENIESPLLLIIFILITSFFIIRIFYNLNLKAFYFTSNNLIIKKYIGKNIILPLGEFYIIHGRASSLGLDISDVIGVYMIPKDMLPRYYFTDFYTNIDKAIDIIKPYIENYCLTIDENIYQAFKHTSFINNEIKDDYIDFDKIDTLRKEQTNNG